MNPSNTSRILGRVAVLAAAAAVAGCNIVPPAQEDSTRYFVLSGEGAPATPAPAPAGLRIGLKSVKLESYLKNRSMVVRTGENEVRFEDFRRWAEPLDTAIQRSLRARLLADPAIAQVLTEPFPFDQQRDYDVAIEVNRFEGEASGPGKYTVELVAVIEVTTPGANPRVVAREVFAAPSAAWDGADYGRMAALLAADVSALGQQVLTDLPAKP